MKRYFANSVKTTLLLVIIGASGTPTAQQDFEAALPNRWKPTGDQPHSTRCYTGPPPMGIHAPNLSGYGGAGSMHSPGVTWEELYGKGGSQNERPGKPGC
jgi:hypothetical protein